MKRQSRAIPTVIPPGKEYRYDARAKHAVRIKFRTHVNKGKDYPYQSQRQLDRHRAPEAIGLINGVPNAQLTELAKDLQRRFAEVDAAE